MPRSTILPWSKAILQFSPHGPVSAINKPSRAGQTATKRKKGHDTRPTNSDCGTLSFQDDVIYTLLLPRRFTNTVTGAVFRFAKAVCMFRIRCAAATATAAARQLLQLKRAKCPLVRAGLSPTNHRPVCAWMQQRQPTNLRQRSGFPDSLCTIPFEKLYVHLSCEEHGSICSQNELDFGYLPFYKGEDEENVTHVRQLNERRCCSEYLELNRENNFVLDNHIKKKSCN